VEGSEPFTDADVTGRVAVLIGSINMLTVRRSFFPDSGVEKRLTVPIVYLSLEGLSFGRPVRPIHALI
jgi:hypothetical protein